VQRVDLKSAVARPHLSGSTVAIVPSALLMVI
jgi:hypothetical protein